MNTLCAAGTGAFLSSQANRLGVKVEDFGKSKSIILRNGTTTPQDIEDIRAAKIRLY